MFAKICTLDFWNFAKFEDNFPIHKIKNFAKIRTLTFSMPT